MFSFF